MRVNLTSGSVSINGPDATSVFQAVALLLMLLYLRLFLFRLLALVSDDANGDSDHQWQVTLPLEACPGGASCLRLTLLGNEIGPSSSSSFQGGSRSGSTHDSNSSSKVPRPTLFPRPMIPYRVYRVIVDTGSPYLVVSENDLDGNVIATGSYPVGYDHNDASDHTDTGSSVARAWSDLVTAIQDTVAAFLPDAMITDSDRDVPFQFSETLYGPTEEIYGSQSGSIRWMSAPIKFRDDSLVVAASGRAALTPEATTSQGQSASATASASSPSIILGAMDDGLTRESGGSLLGLVKRSNLISTKIQRRPTFVEQMRLLPSEQERGRTGQRIESSRELDIASFKLDYPDKQLTLSSTSLIPADATNVFSLVDLRPLGDFVEHYACRVDEIIFDGAAVSSQSLRQGDGNRRTSSKPRDIVAVFDSGLTGCLLIKPFWDRLVEEGLDPSSFASVEIRVKTAENEKGQSRSRTRTNSQVDWKDCKYIKLIFYQQAVLC